MTGYQAIVLAAGAGLRFGGRKLLAIRRHRPLILSAVETALDSPVDEVIVVVGCEGEIVTAALGPLANVRLRIVDAPEWREGMSASLRAGLASLPTDSRGVLLFLGDMPDIPGPVPQQVLDALMSGATAVRPTCDGAPGHPVGLSSALYPDLMGLSGDQGANAILRDRTDVTYLAVDDIGAVFDVDQAPDLKT